MAENNNFINIGGRLHSIATGNVLAGTDEIYDDGKGKKQSTINTETDAILAQHTSVIQGLNSQNYETYAATNQTTVVTDVLPATGSVNTIYRLGNWDGSQFDPSCYTEYSWNGTQYVPISTKTQIDEVFNISAYHASGGILATYADLSAALDSNNGGGVPQSLQRGGMSIKFVCSSDNKYVQYRLMSNTFSTTESDWQGVDNEPTPDSKNLVKSGGITKVYGSVTYQPNYVYVILDNESKLLVGVENNGNVVFGSGVPQQIIDYVTNQIGNLGVDSIVTFLDNLLEGDKTLEDILDELNLKVDELGKFDDAVGYIQTIVDSEGKIIEGIDSEGKKIINTKVLFNSNLESQTEEKSTDNRRDFLEVKVDKDNKIIEGITVNGKKYISDFAKETELSIRKLSNVIQIDELNSDFSSSIPVVITGEKGSPGAKYDFILSLNKDAFNIRFKFKITENLLNQNKSAVICKLGNSEIVKASSVPLVQQTSTETYQGQQKTNYWPCLGNGVSLGGSFHKGNNNIGQIAFSIKYSGNENVVTVRNTGSEFILNIGDTTYSFSYETYNTVSELYEALKAIEDIVVDYRDLNNKNCVDLAIFPECNLKPTMYTGITGQSGAPIVEYVDAAEFMVPYAIDDLWHYVEIVKINGVIYSTCDGNTKVVTIPDVSNVVLTLGGNCDVLFKNLTIYIDSVYDAECVNGVIISSYNPYIIIYEGHGIDKVPSIEATVSENMNTTIDRLEYVFQLLKDKEYIPVSVKDISEWYNGNKELPKRCYTIIFDDFRFDNIMDIDNRSVFTRFNVKPALAIISNMFQTTDIYHNGSVISGDKAVEISTMYDFMLVSHTKNHRYNGAVKPSEMINELKSDIYANEICGVNGLYFVFPFGSSNPYMFWVMNWLGYYLGFNVWNGTFDERNTFNRSKYNLIRYEIGMRESISNIIQGIK